VVVNYNENTDFNMVTFRNLFEEEYLHCKTDIVKQYSEWSQADPKYFAKIAEPLGGMRCLRQDPWECTMSFICS